jgi:hypothetical protein
MGVRRFRQEKAFLPLPLQISPALFVTAPVNAPFSYPKSSDSIIDGESSAQFTAINDSFERGTKFVNEPRRVCDFSRAGFPPKDTHQGSQNRRFSECFQLRKSFSSAFDLFSFINAILIQV